MLRRSASIVSLTLVALTLSTGSALAASSSTIHRDAADGSIDGDYTLAELRAADRTVSAQQREYGAWDDIYRAAIRAKSSGGGGKDTVVPAVPVDQDRDGVVEPAERQAAVTKTKEKCEKAGRKARASTTCRRVGVSPDTKRDTPDAEPDDDEDDEREVAASKDDEDEGGSPLLWVIVGIPLLIVLFGAWRFMRGRRGPKGDLTT